MSGSRSEQLGDELPVSLDVVNQQEAEFSQMQDIRDAVRDLPNLSVPRGPSRFAITGPARSTGRDGSAGFQIRGLGGNRVLMLVDGVRVPHSYIFGSNAFGRDYLSIACSSAWRCCAGRRRRCTARTGWRAWSTLSPMNRQTFCTQHGRGHIAGRAHLHRLEWGRQGPWPQRHRGGPCQRFGAMAAHGIRTPGPRPANPGAISTPPRHPPHHRQPAARPRYRPAGQAGLSTRWLAKTRIHAGAGGQGNPASTCSPAAHHCH